MPLVPVGVFGRRAIRRISPWAGYSAALATLLSEAQNSGLVLDFTQNIAFRAGTQSTIAGVSGFTYTRTGTAYDLAGTTSFGPNVPRRTSAGLLVEAAATNLLLQSQTFDNASWSKNGATVTADAGTAPDGTLTADKLVETATTGTHDVRQTFTFAASTTYTLSIFFAPAERTFASIIAFGGAFAASTGVQINLTTGAVTTLGGYVAFTTTTVTLLAGGYVRVACTFTTNATGGSSTIGFLTSNGTAADSFTGTAGSGVFLWGAQLETGSAASSYIPTTTASASRGADAASITGLTFSGAHSVIALTGQVSTAGSQHVYNLDDTSAANRTLMYNGGSISLLMDSGGVNQTNGNAVGTWASTGFRVAARFNTNDVRGAGNGALGTADTVATLPVGTLSRLTIGGQGGGGQFINGLIQLLAILPRALSDGELTGATA